MADDPSEVQFPDSFVNELVEADDPAFVRASLGRWLPDLVGLLAGQRSPDDELRQVILRDIDRALASGEVTFHYQPVVRLESEEILGAEALVRWQHPQVGFVPPPVLVECIRTSGRSEAFTRWSLATVAADWIRIRRALPWFADKGVSYNLSPDQLRWQGYADFHVATLAAAGLRAEDVIVEVVESQGILPGDAAETTVHDLADSGVLIALDDFGTGHNVLGYMTRLPIHAIKFDRSLVSVVAENRAAQRILRALGTMSRDLGIVALAEGIETEEVARTCRQLGLEDGQGWFFGRPVPLDDFIAQCEALGPPRRLRRSGMASG